VSSNGEEPIQRIEPQPTPFSYEVGRAVDGQSVALVLRLLTGTVVLFIPSEFANQMGRDMLKESTGIVVPQTNNRFTPPQ